MNYKLANGGIKRSDGAFIPEDESNSDYQEFLKYVAGGGLVAPADPMPEKVTYIPVQTIFQRLKTIGKDETVWSALSVSQQLEFLTLKEGIAQNDENVRALLLAMNINPDEILY